MERSYIHRLVAILCLSSFPGCESVPDAAESARAAETVAQLVALNHTPSPSIFHLSDARDSIARLHGFADAADVIQTLRNASLDPTLLRTLLDSVQAHLQ